MRQAVTRRLNGWMWIVAVQREILVGEIKEAMDLRVETHTRRTPPGSR